MVNFKKIINIYIFITILSQIYSFIYVQLRLYYLYEIKRSLLQKILHLSYPIISYKHKYGFYSLVFNLIPIEIYIKTELRSKGYGIELSKYLFSKYNIFIISPEIMSTIIRNCDSEKISSSFNNLCSIYSLNISNEKNKFITFNFIIFILCIKIREL